MIFLLWPVRYLYRDERKDCPGDEDGVWSERPTMCHPDFKIFENRSNLASNCRASNRKFLATFEPPI